MKYIIFFSFIILHWYLSLFVQTVFYHRYAAHRQFYMNPFWEKFFYVLAWLVHGVGYLSPTAYGVMHKLHHMYTDKEEDPHSPVNSKTIIEMYNDTKKHYLSILKRKKEYPEYLYHQVPTWDSFDRIACSKYSRLFWLILYTVIYWILAPSLWCWLFLPFQLLIAPIQGLLINWFAHQTNTALGYRNYELKNLSHNLMPVDVFFLGEAYHNNHHANPRKVNFKVGPYELDAGYYLIILLSRFGIVKI